MDKTCPFCQRVTDEQLAVGGAEKETPSPGDATICFYCWEMSVFDQDMSLKKPTPEDEASIAAQPEVPKIRRMITTFKKADDKVRLLEKEDTVNTITAKLVELIRDTNLDFSYFERRMRILGLSHPHLVSIPARLAPKEVRVVGPRGPDSGWLWVCLNGEAERDAKLLEIGTTAEANIAALADTGVLVTDSDEGGLVTDLPVSVRPERLH
jgi:hypothetical protein